MKRQTVISGVASAFEDPSLPVRYSWRSRTTQLHPARHAQAACGTDP